jgi:hypothetical protein
MVEDFEHESAEFAHADDRILSFPASGVVYRSMDFAARLTASPSKP